ncbi:MAG: hypothetical protein DWQ02_04140 [Bacteroidetes bacterium]|nr:MAG: hypothetical protein DWQ02_04140 [Bacteroidota bacterium]
MINPNLSPGKVKFYDFILNMLPVLKVGKVNRMIARNEHLSGVPFVKSLCDEAGIFVNVTGIENLPKKGPVTIVANHPGGADVLGTIIGLGAVRPDLGVLANKLICVDQIKDLVIPIDMMAKVKVDPEMIREAYRRNKVVVFFAAGKNSRYNNDGLLRDRRWRTSFLDFASEFNTPIHVMRINGANTPLFYKVSKFRSRYKSLKNVPLENMFQLRELLNGKGTVQMFLSKAVSFPPSLKPENISDIQFKRKKADILHDFVYRMDENNLEFK